MSREAGAPIRRAWGGLSLVAALVLLLLSGVIAAPPAGAVHPSVSGTISGPSDLGEGLSANYTLSATGGPAEAANGTTVGVYSYNATLTGGNTTGATISPQAGVLENGSAVVSLKAPNVAEALTISVDFKSSYQSTNQSDNVTYTVNIVEPFRLNATLISATGVTVGPLTLTVTLDGAAVGTIHVPVMTSASTYPIRFAYVDTGIAPGWHTFSISLASQHGLVTFPGGAQQYSQSFYVTGPPPDYTVWYVAGIVAFLGAVFIWSTRVAARRRGRAKK